jgi:cell division septum initiation protein DivIVA
MVNFTGPDESDSPSRADAATGPAEAATAHESPTSPARLLEIAAVTADRLVADAKTEAESLVSAARTEADAVLEASRSEVRRVEAELARNKEQQTAELERERATALAGLADEKAALEERIATLRELQSDHRRQLRDHLQEQLSLLDAVSPQPPGAVDH